MTHDELIQSLTADLRPVSRHSLESEFARALGLGGIASLGILLATLGIQPGLAGPAVMPLVMKDAYGLILLAIGLVAAIHLARPGTPTVHIGLPIIAAASGLFGLAAGQLVGVGESELATMFIGSSWQWCSIRIAALALPIFAALVFMLRRQAPVRLRRAGAAAGLVAGAFAACIYAFACAENSAAFVLVWYSAGIAATSALGWLLGPKLLRW